MIQIFLPPQPLPIQTSLLPVIEGLGTTTTRWILCKTIVLRSHAQRAGIPPTRWNTSIFRKAFHSWFESKTPPSQYVSLSQAPRVSHRFGPIYQFEVLKKDLIPAWWNFFGEKEELSEEARESTIRVVTSTRNKLRGGGNLIIQVAQLQAKLECELRNSRDPV